MTQIRVPKPFRDSTDGQALVEVSGATVGEALDNLVSLYPGVRDELYDAGGNLKTGTDQSVNVLLGKYDYRELAGADTPVLSGDRLMILRTWPAAISGPSTG